MKGHIFMLSALFIIFHASNICIPYSDMSIYKGQLLDAF